MTLQNPRLKREYETLRKMIALWCRKRHASHKTLCPDCSALQAYAETRLERCPYQEKKPTCARCPIHCYSKPMREQVRAVMRFAGPRMILYHPMAAIQHLWDGNSS